MAYKIEENCVLCGVCEIECQNQAISEAKTTFVIDPYKCTECVGNFESPKCVEVCPADCCVPDPEHVESRGQLLEKWHRLHPGEQSGRRY
ncbi:Ferredoxin [subsurface metagenome]